MRIFVVPLTIILVVIPLILRRVPRNPFYGFRTRKSMSSDEIWFEANHLSGIVLLFASILWIVAALALPMVIDSAAVARQAVWFVGLSSIGVGLLVSTILIARL